MKTLSIYASLLFSMFVINPSVAQTSMKKETIKVWGNCGMCKSTIEKAAKNAGVKTANWNEDSKELLVSYAENKTNSAKIQEAIAKSGYDTQEFTADNNAYNKLHNCCKYDRKDDQKENVNTTPATEVSNAYSCPMHPEVTSDKAGTCSKCGMKLKQKS